MVKKKIGILDSGIGGLSVLKELDDSIHNKRLIYMGDNNNAPYGNKGRKELWSLTLNNLFILKEFELDCLVLGCNTLSVNFLHRIQDFLGIKVFGVFPPVEREIIENKNSILICTLSTANAYRNMKNISVYGLANLARDIEDNCFTLNNIDLNSHFSKINLVKEPFKRVILGCTHYNLIKKAIYNHFQPQKIISGVELTVKEVLSYYESREKLENLCKNEIQFIGDCARKNRKIFFKVVKNI